MPALPESANHGINQIAGTATTGTVDVPITINPMAPAVWAVAAVYLVANVDTTGVTVTITFDDDDDTPMVVHGTPVTWDGKKNLLVAFKLQAPPTGQRIAHVSVSGLTAHANGFWIMCDVATYSGVQEIGDPVRVSGDTAGAQTANSVSVPSVAEAYRVVTIHALRTPLLFTANNLTARAQTSGLYAWVWYFLGLWFLPVTETAAGGGLLLQDAPGDDTVIGTCTQPSTNQWGAIGFSMLPAPVVIEAALELEVDISLSLSISRVATPAPERLWVIPELPGKLPDGTEAPLAGNFIKAADGIIMPLWIKDPGDVEDYTLDFSNHLAEDDEIVAVGFTVTNDELSVVSSNFTDTTAQVWLSGGVAGISYGVTCHITTDRGRQHDRSFRIVGGQK